MHAATHPPEPHPLRLRRALLWGALVLLLLVAQSLLVLLTVRYESTRAQDEAEAVAAEVAAQVRHDLMGLMQSLQSLAWSDPPQPGRRAAGLELLRTHHALKRVEWRDPAMVVLDALDSPARPALFSEMPRQDLGLETQLACAEARRAAAPTFSRSYFVPLPGAQGVEVVDLCLPLREAGAERGFLVGSFALGAALEAALPARESRRHEFSFVESDGTRLARAGLPRGAGAYVAQHVVDLPGTPLMLRADSAAGLPSLIPNLATALVIGMSIALFGVVLLLARDVRRREQAERALAEALAFRSAMEDSLSTGLRARDLAGAITYVNPAFCTMVGFTREELHAEQPPYWPPERAPEYLRRQQQRLQGAEVPHEGFETEFMRKDGERFPVMIYEAPLVDGHGRHTGWMSAVLDLSAQRRVEEISRQQQDRLQATARLATVGEMASLLSHELNQPLSAIASYASGSLNLLAAPEGATPAELAQALQRIAEQAERAGRVIKSVHDFVRRRERLHETLGVNVLFDEVLPLVRMQARKSGTRIELDLPAGGAAESAARMPRVRCDRTMVEQVLLNLARNAIQAMETATADTEHVLTLRARQTHPRWVTISVIDAGPGIAPDVATRLFTPFFTTKPEGMGLGLSLCRTVIEQHGGALDFRPGPQGRGTEFRFTLPGPPPPDASEVEGAGTAQPAVG
jgi:two-component system sensor histidine kinase DctS